MLYKNAYIYKLSSSNSIYFGSTTRDIFFRYAQHISSYNRFKVGKGGYLSSFELFDDHNIPVIVLVETLNNVTKQELLKCESNYIQNNECINVNIPIRTYAEKLAYSKKYHKDNFDIINNRKNEKINCETCNCSVSRTNITHHYKSKKHQNLINI